MPVSTANERNAAHMLSTGTGHACCAQANSQNPRKPPPNVPRYGEPIRKRRHLPLHAYSTTSILLYYGILATHVTSLLLDAVISRVSCFPRRSIVARPACAAQMAKPNPVVFFDMTIGGRAAGRIEMLVRAHYFKKYMLLAASCALRVHGAIAPHFHILI